ncbi:MAG TPA: hypothetical protein VF158_13000 [Longimicrobiales bacterium]
MRMLCRAAALAAGLWSAGCAATPAPEQTPAPNPEEAAPQDSIEAARRAEEERRRLEAERLRAEEEERRRAEEEARRAAEQPQEREHVVRRGDTLWDLAGYYFGNPFLWGLIYDANRIVVEDPHWIFPAERLVIPGLRPLPADAAAAGGAGAVKAAGPGAPRAETPRRTRFYSRAARSAEPGGRVEQGRETLRRDLEVPQVRPGEFYSAPWLARADELPRVAQVVSVGDRLTDVSRLPETAYRYNTVYLRPLGSAAPAVGDSLLLVRLDQEIGRWGRVIEPIGIATVSGWNNETISVVVSAQFDVVEEGMYAVPLEAFPGLVSEPPRPVEGGAEGTLIGFEQPQPVVSPRDHAFIDLGREDGIEVGDELEVIRPSRQAPQGGVMVPEERIARLRVVRVAERSATVQVIRLDQPTLRPGLPVRLVAKRP